MTDETQPGDVFTKDALSSGNYDQRLQFVLKNLIDTTGADFGCIYGSMREVGRLNLAGCWVNDTIPNTVMLEVSHWIIDQPKTLKATDLGKAHILDVDGIPDGPRQAIVYPIVLYDELVGTVGLFSWEAGAFENKISSDVYALLELAQSVLENRHLAARLITTEAIATTANAIARNPSPQNIVTILRDYMFDAHITSCFIGFFGPIQPEHPNAPYEYIEVVGSWSQAFGINAGLGTRYPLSYYDSFLDRLYEEKIVTYTDLKNSNSYQIDPFARQMIEADAMDTMTIMLLESESRQLGVLAIMTSQAHEFDPHELRTYQIVTEFLTITTQAEVLQQQADFVQQGRAALLDAVTDGVIMVLPDDAYQILTVNDHFARMFGVDEADVQGTSLWDLVPQMRIPKRLQRTLIKQWKSIEPNYPERVEGEFTITAAGGSQIDMQWYSAPVYKDGTVIGRIFTFHDITSERTSERLRYELLSRISHELRTPLTSIRGFAEFILQAHDDKQLPPLAREYTQIIHTSSIHLNKLVTDIIEITRANAGQLDLHLTQAHLPDLVIQVVARMEPQSKEKNQAIVMELDDDLPPIEMDVDRIDQVLTNLISNAVKYSPENTQIRVKTILIDDEGELPSSAPSDIILPCVLVAVVDQGKGFTHEEAEQIFLPFYRTPDARRAKIEGSGLGLAITQSIVELHRGQLWAQPATRKEPGGRIYFSLMVD